VLAVQTSAAIGSTDRSAQPRPGTFSRRPAVRASPSTAPLPMLRPDASQPAYPSRPVWAAKFAPAPDGDQFGLGQHPPVRGGVGRGL
jgi:hypothetical protein